MMRRGSGLIATAARKLAPRCAAPGGAVRFASTDNLKRTLVYHEHVKAGGIMVSPVTPRIRLFHESLMRGSVTCRVRCDCTSRTK